MNVQNEVEKLRGVSSVRHELEFATEFRKLMENQFQGTQMVQDINATTESYANANATTMASRIKELAEATRRAWG